jgi:hypothetical protein
VANDESQKVKELLQALENILGAGVNKIIRNWGTTQHLNVTEQLNAGIRWRKLTQLFKIKYIL